jgi:hypothetical protein
MDISCALCSLPLYMVGSDFPQQVQKCLHHFSLPIESLFAAIGKFPIGLVFATALI